MSPASPQPPSDQTQSRKDGQDEREDLFATLFSPPTPPASPFPTLVPDSTAVASFTKSNPSKHPRRFSTSSNEFGSFVSVPAKEDPLCADHQAVFPSTSPPDGLQFFDHFTDHAAKSNAQKSQVLDELLLHQDDPLYWVNNTNEPALSDPYTLETSAQLSRSLVPAIPEEPGPSDPQWGGQLSDRYANWPSIQSQTLPTICPVQRS